MDEGGSYSARLALLREELVKTGLERKAAIAEFDCIIREVPGMLPAPDGSLRIHQAHARMVRAEDAHIQLLKRYADLLIEQSKKLRRD